MSNEDYMCLKAAVPYLAADRGLIGFDLGCNVNPIKVGEHTDYTALLLHCGLNIEHVYAFEPVHYHSFEERYKDNPKVTLIKKAVSDVPGKASFYCPQAHGLSSLWHRAVFKTWKDSPTDVVEVECVTLDDVIKEYSLPQIDYLKIDVEGAEFAVLKGATNALKSGKIIAGQFEFGDTFDDAGTSEAEIVSFLKEHGYEVVYRGGSNCVFKRS